MCQPGPGWVDWLAASTRASPVAVASAVRSVAGVVAVSLVFASTSPTVARAPSAAPTAASSGVGWPPCRAS
jgi:hypothetical protein